MGFLDDYDIDLDEFNESGFDNPADGTYEFEVLRGETKVGTAKDSEAVHIVIYFNLENEDGETQTWNWWLKVPSDPQRPTRRESISMSDWKKWLLGAGFDESSLNEVGHDDIEGIRGTMRLVSSQGRGKNSDQVYQNPKDWTFDGADEEEEEKPKKAAPKPASKPKKAAPAPEPDEDDEEEEEKPKKANPFAKKK